MKTSLIVKTSHSKDEEKKKTSEKPVSLSPLGFIEALEDLLKIKPKEKKKEGNKKEPKK